MWTPPKKQAVVRRWPVRRVFLRVHGTVQGRQASIIRRRQEPQKLVLRARYDQDMLVHVRRRSIRWHVTTYTGNDFEHLFSVAQGEDVQIVVEGIGTGEAALVEVI